MLIPVDVGEAGSHVTILALRDYILPNGSMVCAAASAVLLPMIRAWPTQSQSFQFLRSRQQILCQAWRPAATTSSLKPVLHADVGHDIELAQLVDDLLPFRIGY